MIPFTIKHVLCCFFVLGSFALNAQDFQGKAYYASKTTVDMSNFGRPNMSEEQRKRMESRIKSMSEKTFVLHFTRTEAVYKQEEKLQAPNQGWGSRFGGMMSGAVDGVKYKNIKSKESLTELELFGKLFLMKESLPELNWKMTGETKQIGGYTCYKATASKTWEELNMNTLRNGVANRDEASVDTEAVTNEALPQVTAWYTMDIPVSQGPGDYWGLPGLILEVSTDQTTILCSKIILNPEQKETIKTPSKGKSISREDYVELATTKFQEMRENWRRGRGGRR